MKECCGDEKILLLADVIVFVDPHGHFTIRLCKTAG